MYFKLDVINMLICQVDEKYLVKKYSNLEKKNMYNVY